MLRSGSVAVTLPNGLSIHATRREEALLVYDEVGSYVRHGMSLRPGDVIVDVGANLGLFSLWAWDACGRDATVWAFEPIPAIFALLEKNLRGRAGGRLEALNVGLSDHEGTATFAYHPNAPFASTAFPDASDLPLTETLLSRSLDRLPRPLGWVKHLPAPARRLAVRGLSRIIQHHRPVQCRLTTLSSVIESRGIERIDFLKIDAEKSELDVLNGITPAHFGRIRQAFVEVHDQDGRVDAVARRFRDHGFDKVVIEQEDFFRGTDIHAVSAMRGVR